MLERWGPRIDPRDTNIQGAGKRTEEDGVPERRRGKRVCRRNVKEGKGGKCPLMTSKGFFWSECERSVKGSQCRTNMLALGGN